MVSLILIADAVIISINYFNVFPCRFVIAFVRKLIIILSPLCHIFLIMIILYVGIKID
jgi:hypothetical protein